MCLYFMGMGGKKETEIVGGKWPECSQWDTQNGARTHTRL